MIETFFLLVLFSKDSVYLEVHRDSKEVISGADILGRCIKVFYVSYLSDPSDS